MTPCPACGEPAAYVGLWEIACRSAACAHFNEALARRCPVCDGAADCPGWDRDTLRHNAPQEPLIECFDPPPVDPADTLNATP